MVTPREIMRDFLALLNIIKDNPTATFENLMGNVTFTDASPDDDELTAEEVVSIAKTKVNLFDLDI